MTNPARGLPTPENEHGRIARLVHIAKMAGELAEHGMGIDWGTGNGVIMKHVEGATGRGFDGIDVGEFPPSSEYKMATCFDVIEHAHDGERVLDGIHDVLSDGSPLVITVPSKWWLFETHAETPFNRLPFFNWGPWGPWMTRKVGRNVPAYTKSMLTKELVDAGFEVKEMGYLTAPLDRLIGGGSLIRNHHETKIPFFATNIWAIATKGK